MARLDQRLDNIERAMVVVYKKILDLATRADTRNVSEDIVDGIVDVREAVQSAEEQLKLLSWTLDRIKQEQDGEV